MNKLEQLHLDAIEKSHHGYGYSNDDKMQAASKSVQITENISIEFAEWVSKYDWVFMSDRNYWVNDDMSKKPESTKYLFAEFLKQRQ